MRNPVARLLLPAALALSTLSFSAFDASGQARKKEEPLTPPVANQSTTPKTSYSGLALLIVGVMLVVGVNLIPSKRGHQD